MIKWEYNKISNFYHSYTDRVYYEITNQLAIYVENKQPDYGPKLNGFNGFMCKYSLQLTYDVPTLNNRLVFADNLKYDSVEHAMKTVERYILTRVML